MRAEEALAIGLVDRVVAADAVLDTALEWAASLASGAVVAMGLAKRAIDGGLDGSLSAGLDLEADGFTEVFATDDAQRRHPQLPRRRPRQSHLLREVGAHSTSAGISRRWSIGRRRP